MHRSPIARSLLLVLALALVASACSGRDDEDSTSTGSGGGDGGTETADGVIDTADCPDTGTAGISDDNVITLASSFPQSGLTAAFAQISKGYKAYFDKVNADGGIEVAGESYTVEVVDQDDEYDAAQTVTNINELAGSPDYTDAFAVFNVVGTANNVAIREVLGDNCVPNVFAATGSPVWGNPDFPWTIGSTLAPYTVEASSFVELLKDEQPDATVAMLVQDDDFGDAYREGVEQAIEGTDITIAQVETYPAGSSEVAAQMTSLNASGADVFFNGATLLACPTALQEAQEAEYEITFVSGTCISKTLMGIAGEAGDDAYAVTNIKDAVSPEFADDPAMVEYKEALAEFGESDVDPENGIVAYGYTQADILRQVLEGLPELTRGNLMNAMYEIDGLTSGLMIDGSTVTTSAEDRFLAENVQLVQYDAAGGYFDYLGEVLDFEGATTEITPADLIES
jgi:branched-chain amino acid transport system substrate-binding protein